MNNTNTNNHDLQQYVITFLLKQIHTNDCYHFCRKAVMPVFYT